MEENTNKFDKFNDKNLWSFEFLRYCSLSERTSRFIIKSLSFFIKRLISLLYFKFAVIYHIWQAVTKGTPCYDICIDSSLFYPISVDNILVNNMCQALLYRKP